MSRSPAKPGTAGRRWTSWPPPARMCCCSTCTCPGWTGTPCSPHWPMHRTGLPSSCSPPPPATSTSSAPCAPGRDFLPAQDRPGRGRHRRGPRRRGRYRQPQPRAADPAHPGPARPPPPDPLQPLSPREREVLRLIARGHSNRQIGRDLAIGEQTVKTHVRSILIKLGVQDRVQAAISPSATRPTATSTGRDARPPGHGKSAGAVSPADNGRSPGQGAPRPGIAGRYGGSEFAGGDVSQADPGHHVADSAGDLPAGPLATCSGIPVSALMVIASW